MPSSGVVGEPKGWGVQDFQDDLYLACGLPFVFGAGHGSGQACLVAVAVKLRPMAVFLRRIWSMVE